MNISKQGIISASEFSEIPVNPYDTTIYTEPDGSNWIRIFHHNNPANTSNLFAASDDFESFVYKNENAWLSAPLLYFITNEEWEFMVKQKKTSSDTEVKYRWIQSKNPYLAAYRDVTAAKVTYNTSSGYSSSSYGGLYKKGTGNNTFFSINDGNSSDWFGAIGSYTVYKEGIPGYPRTAVTSGYIDLYLKVDYLRTNDTASIYQNCMSGMELNEI